MRRAWVPLVAGVLATVACDDVIFETHGIGEPPAGDGWCAVEGLISSSCLACHSTAAQLGGLDLEADPHGSLIDQPSSSWPGEVLVVPGDPDASLLQQKLEGTQTSGDAMPPTGPPPADTVSAVRDWIAAGADDVCVGGVGGTTPDRTHPAGWSAPGEHGLATKLQTYVDCRTCHGSTLDGGIGPSCDLCHQGGGDAWRTDCTFCHGGDETSTGAPPHDIDGTSAVADTSFPPHTAHVQGTWHAPFACTTCHAEPTDVLTPGHFLDDDTPAVAEVDLSAGLSPGGTFTGGGCGNLYCHGDGQTTGAVAFAEAPLSCDSCHRTSSGWDAMSGEHLDHVGGGLDCVECHGDVVDTSLQIVGLDLHVNGTPDLALPDTIQLTGNTCTGRCHNIVHDAEDWE